MTISGFALITLVLFMVHEFEEIIFVRRYIDKHADNNRYHDELFVAGRDHYPSTAAIAAMIAEEFVVACLILVPGSSLILLRWWQLCLSPTHCTSSSIFVRQ